MRWIQRLDPVADAADQRRYPGEADRNIGTEPGREGVPVDAAGALGIGAPHGPQQRRRIRRSATEPGSHGQVLLEFDGAEAQPGIALAQQRQRPL